MVSKKELQEQITELRKWHEGMCYNMRSAEDSIADMDGRLSDLWRQVKHGPQAKAEPPTDPFNARGAWPTEHRHHGLWEPPTYAEADGPRAKAGNYWWSDRERIEVLEGEVRRLWGALDAHERINRHGKDGPATPFEEACDAILADAARMKPQHAYPADWGERESERRP